MIEMPRSAGADTCGCRDVLRALWAKDPHDLGSGMPPFSPTPHLLDAAAAIQVLWRQWLRPGLRELIVEAIGPGDEPGAVSSLMLMAGLHDVGKINPLFQTQPFGLATGSWRPQFDETLAKLGLPVPPQGVIVAAGVPGPNFQPGHTYSVARRHEYVGAYALLGQHTSRQLKVQPHWLQSAICGHHGVWRAPESPYDFNKRDDFSLVESILAGGWRAAIEQQRTLIEDTLDLRLADVPQLQGSGGAAFILASGLLILADWLASEDRFVAAGKQLIREGLDPVGNPQAWLAARLADMPAHVAATVGALQPLGDACAAILGDHDPRPLQQSAIRLGPADGLWLVAFPTGEGKTRAAELRHVQRPDEHMLFALPTMATTDAMAATLRDDFHQTGNAVVVSHQFAGLTQADGVADSDAHLYANPWFATAVRRLIAPVAVMTCDQILAAALNQKSTHLRLLAIANHHVVLDEVHTFDAYQRELLVELLAWLGTTRTRVTLLSASIPLEDAVAYRNAYTRGALHDRDTALPFDAAYPSHSLLNPRTADDISDRTDATVALSSTVPPVTFRTVETVDVAQARAAWVLKQTRTHPCCHVAVVCNRVDSAIETAREVQGSLPDTHDLIVLHSRMTRSQRAEVEANLRRRLGPPPSQPPNGASAEEMAACEAALARYSAIRPTVVIATQIIEASLDLDFDVMASDLAPSPSLVQRAGRLWRFRDTTHRRRRHGQHGPGREVTVFVSCNEDGSLSVRGSLPYEPAELRKVAGLIAASPVLRVPDDIQGFVDGGRVGVGDLLAGEEIAAEMAAAEAPPGLPPAEVERFIGAQLERIAAAEVSRAKLLKTIIAPRALTYGSLMDLTRLPDDENAMRTRYADLPTTSFIIFDSGPTPSRHVVTGPVPPNAHRVTGAAIRAWQAAVLPASGRHRLDLLQLHQATMRSLGRDEWKPESAVLKHQYPVDLALRDDTAAAIALEHPGWPMGTFDDLVGWASDANWH